MISSKSVSSWYRSHARLDDGSRNSTFWRGYPNLMHSYGWLIENRVSKLWLLKFTQLKISYAGCPCLSSVIAAQFTLEMCSRSFKVINAGTRGKLVSSKSVSICNRSHTRWVNSGKINDFLGRQPSLTPSFEGNLLSQRHKIPPEQTSDSRLSHGKKRKSLSNLGLNRYRVMTDGRTELRQLVCA